jgi:hypothetical protein
MEAEMNPDFELTPKFDFHKIHDWMKPFIEEYGLHPETVRILGHEGIQDEIMEALKRAEEKGRT